MANCLPSLFQNNRGSQLISGDGEFKEAGFKDIVKLHKRGVSYAVVAIMGQQSSGKSTLLNHLFHTDFEVMDANEGRKRATNGIWIEKAPNMEPLTMVLDMEGTDGQERGENGTTFEKQSALFALIVADILLINICCTNIGLEQAANRPLLKTIFEAMMRLFSPAKTTLIFVLRNKTKSSVQTLEKQLRDSLETIWKTTPKPQGREDTPLTEFFNVEVTVLSNYEYMEEEFKEQVAQLRDRYFHSISLIQDVHPSPKLSFSSAKKIWEIIKDSKDLDLPTLGVMVATVRCEEIVTEKLRLFATDEEWLAVERRAKNSFASGFGATISSILRRNLSEYDSESSRFDEYVRNAKRQYLVSEFLKLVHPSYTNTLGHLRSEALKSFQIQLEAHLSEGGGFAESVLTCRQSCKLQFDQQCSDHANIEQAQWDVSTERQRLLHDIDNHTLVVRTEKLPHVVDQHRERLSVKIHQQLREVFTNRDGNDITWAAVRSLLERQSNAAASALPSAVGQYEVEQATIAQMVRDLKQYATELVKRIFEEKSRDVVNLMKQRFVIALSENDRESSANQGSTGTTEEAYRKCLKLLSTMAVVRLDEREDNVESVLVSALMGGGEVSEDPLASTAWEEVPPAMTLITPIRCKEIWEQFKQEMERSLAQANHVEEECRNANHPLIPKWAIVGLAVLGFAGFTFLLSTWGIEVALLISLVSLVSRGIQVLVVGISIYRNIEAHIHEQGDFIDFRRSHRRLMRSLKQALKKFYKLMNAILGRESAVTVAA